VTTFLFVQGLDPVELAEDQSFNLARSRGNQALTGTNHKGEQDRSKPMNRLSFKTAAGGRIAVNPEKFIGVGSDVARDEGAGSGDGETEAE
jgi:hypothetical protein